MYVINEFNQTQYYDQIVATPGEVSDIIILGFSSLR